MIEMWYKSDKGAFRINAADTFWCDGTKVFVRYGTAITHIIEFDCKEDALEFFEELWEAVGEPVEE